MHVKFENYGTDLFSQLYSILLYVYTTDLKIHYPTVRIQLDDTASVI
jgi:hypothetical protein